MGRTTTVDEPTLDLDVFFNITVAGEGIVMPWNRNVKNCKCAACRAALEIGKGFKFAKSRFADAHSGYLCGECVTGCLGKIERWYWNRFFKKLFPATDQSPTLDGRELAEVWNEHGLSGLAFLLNQDQPTQAALTGD